MTQPLQPYIATCSFCEQGLIRIARCQSCHGIVAICDECEAVWADPRHAVEKQGSKADTQHPACPHCGTTDTTWQFLNIEEITRLGLDDVVQGTSK